MRSKITVRLFSLLCVLGVLIIGCAPRGETKNLDEILANAKGRYTALQREGKIEKPLQEKMANLGDALDALVSQAETGSVRVAESATGVAVELAELTPKAGYTARPAFGELTKQYRHLGKSDDGRVVEGAKVKLLVARTYSLLAGELETSAFRVG